MPDPVYWTTPFPIKRVWQIFQAASENSRGVASTGNQSVWPAPKPVAALHLSAMAKTLIPSKKGNLLEVAAMRGSRGAGLGENSPQYRQMPTVACRVK